jgi:hypothetical protein
MLKRIMDGFRNATKETKKMILWIFFSVFVVGAYVTVFPLSNNLGSVLKLAVFALLALTALGIIGGKQRFVRLTFVLAIVMVVLYTLTLLFPSTSAAINEKLWDKEKGLDARMGSWIRSEETGEVAAEPTAYCLGEQDIRPTFAERTRQVKIHPDCWRRVTLPTEIPGRAWIEPSSEVGGMVLSFVNGERVVVHEGDDPRWDTTLPHHIFWIRSTGGSGTATIIVEPTTVPTAATPTASLQDTSDPCAHPQDVFHLGSGRDEFRVQGCARFLTAGKRWTVEALSEGLTMQVGATSSFIPLPVNQGVHVNAGTESLFIRGDGSIRITETHAP